LKVGGPSTAKAQWVSEFAAYCAESNAPLDFVSTHVYPGDSQEQLFGASGQFAQADVTVEAARRVRQAMQAANLATLPFWLTEWSSDSPAMIAHIIAGCLPHCQAMSQWALSGTFEEIYVPDSPQYLKPDQIERLRQRAEIPPPTVLKLDGEAALTLLLPPEGVALIELQ
jgi:xylan 1,4-beta-xylosidase